MLSVMTVIAGMMQTVFEKIIEKLEEQKVKGIYDSSSIIGEKNVWGKAIEIVKQEAEKYNNGWIPVSERLPEEAFGCLVTVIDCNPVTLTEFENILPYVVGYDGNGWNDIDGETIPFEVIAWMELPSAYRPKEK